MACEATRFQVSSDTMMLVWKSLFAPSRREAMFTASPITV